MNLYKVTLSNLAIISQTEQNESPLSSLEALKNAAYVRFSQKNEVISAAEELKLRALNQIGGWTKFWEKVGSLLFSCFGYTTTTQKVESIFEEIKTKRYEVDQEDNRSKEKEDSRDTEEKPLLSPKFPTPPQSPDSPPCTPDEVKVKREELKNDELRRFQAEEAEKKRITDLENDELKRKAAVDAEKNRIADRENEAKSFLEPILPDLLILSDNEVKKAFEDLEKKISTLEEDKQQACYEYICRLDHYFLALSAVNKIKHENQEAFKLRYGLCPDFEIIVKSNPEYSNAWGSNDVASIKNLFSRDRCTNAMPQHFIKFLNDVIIRCLESVDFHRKGEFVKAIQGILHTPYSDIRSDILSRILPDFYKHSQIELDKFIGSLETSDKSLIYFELAKSKISYIGAQNYALKIENEALRKKALIHNGLQNDDECKALLNNQSDEIRILVSKQRYLRAIDAVDDNAILLSLNNYLLRVAAEHYVDRKSWASLDKVIKQIDFEDIKKQFQDILDNVSVEDRSKSELYLKIDKAYFLDEVFDKVDRLDPSLQDDYNAYIACVSESYYIAITCAEKIKDLSRRDGILANLGLMEIDKLKLMPDYVKLKALIKKDVNEAEAFVKSTGSPSLSFYFAKRAIRHFLHRDKYDEASKYLEMIPFIDIRGQYRDEINKDKEKRADNLENFKKDLDSRIFFGEYSDAFEVVEKEKKLAFKEEGYRLLATQTLDSGTAEKACGLIEDLPENYFINLSEIKSEELEPFEKLINDKKFSEARALILSSNIEEDWHFSLNIYITSVEIEDLIERKEWNKALLLISTLPYRNLERDYRLKLARAHSRSLYPNLIQSLENEGVIVDSYIESQLRARIASNDVDIIFKDVVGADVSYFIKRIFNYYFESNKNDKALEIVFLINNHEDYLENLASVYLNEANDKGFDLLKYFPIHKESKLIEQALKRLYFKNETFREKLISAYPEKQIELERLFVQLIEISPDITQAQELLKRIKNGSCIELAKLVIAKKFGDFKAYVDTDSFSLGYYLKDFKRALKTSTIQYSIGDLTYIEERLDLAREKKLLSEDVLKELYGLLGELFVNYHRTRLQGKIKV